MLRGLRIGLCVLALVVLSLAAAQAAPLDVRPGWAEDAVRLLQEYGVVEGYPRGGFRGDRVMTRWEVAMVVARAYARLEGEHERLLGKSELDALAALRTEYAAELDALGVRVGNLEGQVERLDARVEELSKIAFSGQFQAAYIAQNFRNAGNPVGGFGPNALNYDAIVGTLAASNLVPHSPAGILPAIDFTNGRPLTNGSGLSSVLRLNVEARPSDEWTGEVALFAYASQGDSIVDAVWGVQPPYLANSFTGAGFSTPQNLNHTPFTSAGLDHLRVTYHPYNLTLTLGNFLPRFISPQVYIGEVNPRVGDPRLLGSYGFHLAGDNDPFGWEVFGTRLPDGNPGINGANPYQNEALGACLSYSLDGWTAGANFLTASGQASVDGLLTVGQTNLVQGGTGQVNINWVNPNGYFVEQLGGAGSPLVAGVGSTSDKRPIPGIPNSDAFGVAGSFGPQSITMGSLNLEYVGENWNVLGEYGLSDYKPNKNSAYSTRGNLWRFGGGANFLDDTVAFNLEWRHTDARYDPFILVFPGTAANVVPFRSYHRLPDQDQFWHLYSLHNTDNFPQNREGLWFNVRWNYDPDGQIRFRYRNLSQAQTSLQDVRYRPGSLGPGTPNTLVLGFSPGFFDVVFREYSQLSFDANLNPLENPRGHVSALGFDISHVFTDTPWKLDLSYDNFYWDRPSVLSANLGGSQNNVALTTTSGRFAVGFKATDDLLITAGYAFAEMRGHYDPLGVYNNFAIANGSTGFRNRDTFQNIPFVQLNWEVNEQIKTGFDFFYYDTVDRVDPNIFAGAPGGPTALAHPFSFDGYRVGTRVEVNF